MLNMLYETFNIYLKFQNIIDFCFGIIAVIVAKIILNIRNIIHIRNINRILELKNNKTEYTVSFFESEVWSSKIDNKKIKLVPHSESMIPIFIVNILNVSKNKSDISLCHLKDSQYKIDSTKNRFVCGGPFTNTDTYNIFMKYFPYIKD